MRYGYGPERRTDPSALWDDASWREVDEARRLELRHSTVAVATAVERGASVGGELLSLVLAGAMVGLAVRGKRRRRR